MHADHRPQRFAVGYRGTDQFRQHVPHRLGDRACEAIFVDRHGAADPLDTAPGRNSNDRACDELFRMVQGPGVALGVGTDGIDLDPLDLEIIHGHNSSGRPDTSTIALRVSICRHFITIDYPLLIVSVPKYLP